MMQQEVAREEFGEEAPVISGLDKREEKGTNERRHMFFS